MLLQVAKHVIVTIGLVGVGVLIGKLSSKFIHFKQFKFVNKYLKELVWFLWKAIVLNKTLAYILGGLTVRSILRKWMPEVLYKLQSSRLPKSVFHFNPLKYLPYFDDASFFKDDEVPVTPQVTNDQPTDNDQPMEEQPAPETPPAPTWINLAGFGNVAESQGETNVSETQGETNVSESQGEANVSESPSDSNVTETPGQPAMQVDEHSAWVLRNFLGRRWTPH